MLIKFFPIRIFIICSLAIICFLNQKIEAQCAFAGNDTTICGFEYLLIGTPSNGHWTYFCNNLSKPVVLDSLSQDTLNIKVGGCGKYFFIYHVDIGSCISADTVIISFENSSFSNKDIDYKVNIYYPFGICPSPIVENCGNVRTISGVLPPKPSWKIELLGKCDLFTAAPQVYGLDSLNCSADSINLSFVHSKESDSLEWNTFQEAFIELDSLNRVKSNRFNSFFNFISTTIVDQLESKCPLNKCLNSDRHSCTDTVGIDTVRLVVPIHLGGRWNLLQDQNLMPLQDSSSLSINGKNYILKFLKGAKYIGPEDIKLAIYLNENGQLVPITEPLMIKLKWLEEWSYDTTTFFQVKKINQDRCYCNGTLINFSTLLLPVGPSFHCDSLCINFSGNPKVEILGNDIVCSGGFARLDANNSFKSYKWSNGDIARSTNIFAPGTVFLTVTDDQNCEAVDSIVIRLSELPKITISTDKALLCRGECTTLRVTTDSLNLVIWNSKDSTNDIRVCPVDDEVNFVRVVNTDGCISESQFLIRVFNAPKPNAGPDKRITCFNREVRLSPVDADLGINRVFSWEGPGVVGSQKDSLNITVSIAGKYVFVVADSFSRCIGSDTVEVIADTIKPIANAGNDALINCLSPSVILKGDSSQYGAGFNFQWTGSGINGSNRNDINPEVNLQGIYILNVRDLNNNCISFDTVIVQSDLTSVIADGGPDRLIYCDSLFVTLGGFTTSYGQTVELNWSGPGIDSSNSHNQRVFVNKPGTYNLIVRHKISLCSDTAQIIVSLPDSVANVVLNKSSDLGCNIDSVTISGVLSTGDRLIYTWSGPKGLIGSGTDTIVVNKVGKYYLYIYDSTTHCNDFDSIIIEDTGGRPFVNAGPDRSITCELEKVILNGSVNIPLVNSIIEWIGPGISNNSTLLTPTVDKPGAYIISITDKRNNCSGVDTVTVFENLVRPTIELGPEFTLNCHQDSLQLLAQLSNIKSTFDLKWSGPGVNLGNQRRNPLLITIPGVYSAVINTPNPNCIVADTVIINIDTAAPFLNLPDVLWFDCENRNIFYKVDDFSKIDSIEWYDNLNRKILLNNQGREVNFTSEMLHYYIVYYKNGCIARKSFYINPFTHINIGQIIVDSSCTDIGNGSIEILGVTGNGPFTIVIDGSNADTVRKFSNLAPKTYHIRIYDRNGSNSNCFRDTLVTVYEKPTLPAFDNEEGIVNFCRDTILDARSVYQSNTNFPFSLIRWEWYENGTLIEPQNQTISIDRSGQYDLRIINKNGCGIDTIRIKAEQFQSRADTTLMVPNVFTPDETTNNEYKLLYDSAMVKFEKGTYRLQIFNRWGQIVFETNDPSGSWNGTYKKESCSPDTYFVVIRGVLEVCGARKETIIKRSLNLIR